MIIEDNEGCGFVFTFEHVDGGYTVIMELDVTNEIIDFHDSIEWSISKEQASQIARRVKCPTFNDDVLEFGDVDACGFWRFGKGYVGCVFIYEFWAYDDVMFRVIIPLEDGEFNEVLKSLGIIEYR